MSARPLHAPDDVVARVRAALHAQERPFVLSALEAVALVAVGLVTGWAFAASVCAL